MNIRIKSLLYVVCAFGFLGQQCYGMVSRVIRTGIPFKKMAIDCVTKRIRRGFFYLSTDLNPVLPQEFYEEKAQELLEKAGEVPLSFLQERMEQSLLLLFGYKPPLEVQNRIRGVNLKTKELKILDPEFMYSLASRILGTDSDARAYYYYSKIVHTIVAHRLEKELGSFSEKIVPNNDDLLLIESNIFADFAYEYIRDKK